MPIYYTKINQNDELNQVNKPLKSNSYYELTEFDTQSANSILSIDRIYLEENVDLERIETRYGPIVVGKQTYINGKQMIKNNKNLNINTNVNNNKLNHNDIITEINDNTNIIKNDLNKSTNLLNKNDDQFNDENINLYSDKNDNQSTKKEQQHQKRIKLNSIILTIHDVGLNHDSNFIQFFSNLETKMHLKNFTIFHLNLPGQHSSCDQLSSISAYPTIDQMTEIIEIVVSYYDIENFIGFGQGLGANLLIRYALKKPNKVNGLFLINPTFLQASWVEWIYQKRNIKHLQADKNLPDKSLLLSPIVQDYLIWLQFGKASPERDLESLKVIEEYRSYFKSLFIDSYNLSLLIDSYVKRKFINLSRDGLKGTNKLECDCIILAGSLSSMRNESNQLYLRLSPEKSNFIQLMNCGNPLLEKPIKCLEIFTLFLLGLGYTIKKQRPSIIKKSASSFINSTATNSSEVFNESNSCLIDFFTPN